MKTDNWWCVTSPQYGFLPFTAHTNRRGAIENFQLHGVPSAQRLAIHHDTVMHGWRTSKREGFRAVRIRVRAISPHINKEK